MIFSMNTKRDGQSYSKPPVYRHRDIVSPVNEKVNEFNIQVRGSLNLAQVFAMELHMNLRTNIDEKRNLMTAFCESSTDSTHDLRSLSTLMFGFVFPLLAIQI